MLLGKPELGTLWAQTPKHGFDSPTGSARRTVRTLVVLFEAVAMAA